jgi:hypothetical protein
LQGSLIFVFNGGKKNNQHFVDEEGEQMKISIAHTRVDVGIKTMASMPFIFMQWRLIFIFSLKHFGTPGVRSDVN